MPETNAALSPQDLHYFNEGTHRRLYDCLGAQPARVKRKKGVRFAVWAPNAKQVSVVGDFNDWDPSAHPMEPLGGSGIRQVFVPGVGEGERYKLRIQYDNGGTEIDKADPFAVYAEVPPKLASRVWSLDYDWNDADWLARRAKAQARNAPISIYEVHLGSWRRDEHGNELSYRELAPMLADYVRDRGFTHVELMPVTEHPFAGSWGYQTTGYFAPTSRHGTPQELMELIDTLHQAGIGVILDWVPSHFPTDELLLGNFDGTHLFEHSDPKRGIQPDWGSYVFNYGRHEVRSFLLSSAKFWLERYHFDGLRLDAVASMLYLDYSRKEGEWIPNEHGGRENLEAIRFLRQLNDMIREEHPDTLVIAEESTAWPQVTGHTETGGLGFTHKWDMGWMHDTLAYMQNDPVYRKHEHNKLTFRPIYAWSERFVLPLSHDEVVHGKGSLLNKMPGDEWQKLANLRLLFASMYAQPGKKLLFMGGELGQWREWNHDASLDWHLLEQSRHRGVQKLVDDLNRLYRDYGALHERDHDPSGFSWVDFHDVDNSVIAFMRHGEEGRQMLCAFNFTPIPRHNYQLGVPRGGHWREVLNTDAEIYGGSGQGNLGGREANPVASHGRPQSISLTLPPLGAVFLEPAST